jgi:hypothetical protein
MLAGFGKNESRVCGLKPAWHRSILTPNSLFIYTSNTIFIITSEVARLFIFCLRLDLLVLCASIDDLDVMVEGDIDLVLAVRDEESSAGGQHPEQEEYFVHEAGPK